MKKIFLIGWKDVKLVFRDKAALIFMLVAPFALTLGMGLVTGNLGTRNSTILSNIPVVIVNQDQSQLGNTLVEIFQSDDLAALVDVELSDDAAYARTHVNDNEAAAAVIIPAGFTASIIPEAGTTLTSDPVKIEIYSNPTRPTSSGFIQTVVAAYISQVEAGRIGAEVTLSQLLKNGLIQPQDVPAYASQIGESQAQLTASQKAILVEGVTPSGEVVEFNAMAYLAPGYALLFLMYTATNAGRMLLVEKRQGTLPRLLVSPTTAAQVLTGKMIGSYMTGMLQMLILIVASSILFQLKWGAPLAILILVVASVFGAVGWGMLLSALIKTPGQAASVGSALMLTFGILGGSFFDLGALPEWVQTVAKITPNYWGQEGFMTLALGAGMGQIWKPLLALTIMGLVLFIVSSQLFKRRGLMEAK
jgi:ABC-2 type transport system permease protein